MNQNRNLILALITTSAVILALYCYEDIFTNIAYKESKLMNQEKKTISNLSWSIHSPTQEEISFSSEISSRKDGVTITIHAENLTKKNIAIPQIPSEYVELEITNPEGITSIEPSIGLSPGVSPSLYGELISIPPMKHSYLFDFRDSANDEYLDPRIAHPAPRSIFSRPGAYKIRIIIHYNKDTKWISEEKTFKINS
jgi:hypothetical protein